MIEKLSKTIVLLRSEIIKNLRYRHIYCFVNIQLKCGLHLVGFPVTQGLHSYGPVGGDATQLQRRDGGTPTYQVGQQLLTVLDSLFFSLGRKKPK